MKCPYQFNYLFYRRDCSSECRYMCDSGLCALSVEYPLTLEETAQHFYSLHNNRKEHLTRERIRQTQNIAIRKITVALNCCHRGIKPRDLEQLLDSWRTSNGTNTDDDRYVCHANEYGKVVAR